MPIEPNFEATLTIPITKVMFLVHKGLGWATKEYEEKGLSPAVTLGDIYHQCKQFSLGQVQTALGELASLGLIHKGQDPAYSVGDHIIYTLVPGVETATIWPHPE